MKLWVDDERPAPEGWVWAKTSETAIGLVMLANYTDTPVVEISLDHDLGGDDTTRPLVLWMAEQEIWPEIVRVHTQNPVGREWIEGMIERYGPGVAR